MNIHLHKREIELQGLLGFWLSKEEEEEEVRQKSRESWLRLGDRNTKFFYNACKVRIHKNQLNHLFTNDGRGVAN